MQIKHKGRRYLCPRCNRDYISKFAYERHMERRHEDEEVECNEEDENQVYISEKIEMTTAAKDAMIRRLKAENKKKDQQIEEYKLRIAELEEQLKKQNINVPCASISSESSHTSSPHEKHSLLPTAVIKALDHWVTEYSVSGNLIYNKLAHGLNKRNILELTDQDLNRLIKFFIEGVRKPDNKPYAPDTIFFIALSIQKFLYENDRNENIFTGSQYVGVAESLDKILENFHTMHVGSRHVQVNTTFKIFNISVTLIFLLFAH